MTFKMSRRFFWVWTVSSALVVWFALTVAENLKIEQCQGDGRAWDWKRWDCANFKGTIILPSGLRRVGND